MVHFNSLDENFYNDIRKLAKKYHKEHTSLIESEYNLTNEIEDSYSDGYLEGYLNGYNKGFNEYHRIMVVKACDWLTEKGFFGESPTYWGKEEFRKAMERWYKEE